MIAEGARAPDFTATDDAGTSFQLLEELRGPVILHFFVLAWTGV